jgi:prevent-host-death family protein
MSISISAAEANRKFSLVLREVRGGETYVVTSHGRPVAKIVPIDPDDTVREEAFRALLARLRSNPILNVPRWTRDELYDEDAE